MRKNFNSVQMLETSEVCNKISKSVSYETLVGGTATIGRGYKQIRRLFLSSADKPLSAVGTLTSLLCNSAKVVEKWLQISPVLRLVKVLGLVAVLSVGIIGESWGEEIPAGGVSGTCNTDGTCFWSIDSDGTMNIYSAPNAKDVVMSDFICDKGKDNRPWKNSIKSIKKLIVGDNITNIGSNAFESASRLKEVYGMKNVKTIGLDAFLYNGKLEYIEMPAVEYLGTWALQGATNLTSVDMPNIKTIEANALANATALQYVGLPVDENGNPLNVNIADNAFGGANSAVINCTNANRTACGSCGNDYVKRGVGCVKDCGSGYLGKEGRCIDSALGCGAGYRQFDNFCNRIQYTPAEAAEVLRDDNTNSVTITFKK